MLIKKKSKSFYLCLIKYLTKKGNSNLAKKNLNIVLLKVSKKLKIDSQTILLQIFKRLQVFVEVKDIERRGKKFKIPFPISMSRQKYLSLKWLFYAINQDKRPYSLHQKIYFEFLSILESNKSKSIILKKTNLQLALANRAHIHYRW